MKLVADLMRSHVVTVAPDDSLRKAIRLMNDSHIRRLPVVVDGRLVGILTDRDIRLHAVFLEDRFENADSFNEVLETPVDGVMTRDVKVLRPHQTLDDALSLLIGEKFGGAPVVEGEDRLAGIVTYIDLLAEFRRTLNP